MYLERAYSSLPIYTADVSGVCSALYELGGMVVIHDPSGCNSTYNTHDETRWYDRDSLIFISGLQEIDAVLGNDDKFVEDTVQTALELHPAFIALVCSPIPYMNGTDFPALARLIETRTGIPTFHVPANGMHDYIAGVGQAFLKLAERFVHAVEKTPSERCRVNILGMTPLDFPVPGTTRSLCGILEARGFSVQSCWAMDGTLEEIASSAAADVNLVISAAGLPTAEFMRRVFGIPWAAGLPVGALADEAERCLRLSAADGKDRLIYENVLARSACADAEHVFYGEAVCMQSLAAAYAAQTGETVRTVCPLEESEKLFVSATLYTDGEEACRRALRGAETLTADPFCRAVMPDGCKLYPLPQLALSGRNYLPQAYDIFKEKLPWD